MAILADCHMHSSFSTDSDSSMEDMIKEGIQKGLSTMCFTEHMDIDFPEVDDYPDAPGKPFDLNTDSYLYELLRCKEKYKEQIRILFGVEIGMQPHLRRELAVYAKSHEFDYIIASQHLVDKMDPYYPVFWEHREEKAALKEYFETLYQDIKIFPNFDALGHLDYIIRYSATKDANYCFQDFQDCINPILQYLVDHEKALEINSGAIRHGLKDFNPGKEIIMQYKDLGGELITFGSDAHSPQYIATYFDRAADELKECGFKYYAVYEKRSPEMHRL